MKQHCPRCSGTQFTRSGFVGQLQRYKCKSCDYHYTQNDRGVGAEVKRLAVHLYLEGLGYRAISRLTGVSDVAIAKWINPIKESLLPLRKKKVKVTELHKLEHFFITKNLFNQFGWLLIGIEENKDVCLLGSYTTGNCQVSTSSI